MGAEFSLAHIKATAKPGAHIDRLITGMKQFCEDYQCTMECIHNSNRIIADEDHTIMIRLEEERCTTMTE